MERGKRSIIVFLLAFSICSLAFSSSAQDMGTPAGSYMVELEFPGVKLLLTVSRDFTLLFTSTTDFGILGGRQATPSVGTWTQRGRTIDFVAYSFILDEDGAFIEIQRLSGTATTSDNFATAELNVTLEFFDTSQDVLDPDEMPTLVLQVEGLARRIPVP